MKLELGKKYNEEILNLICFIKFNNVIKKTIPQILNIIFLLIKIFGSEKTQDGKLSSLIC